MYAKLGIKFYLVILLGLGLTLSGISNDSAMGSEIIKFGYVAGITGSGAYPSQLGLKGLTLAVEEINTSGGLLGKKVELVVQDDKGVPANAVTAVQYLIQNGVTLIQGAHHSSCTLAIMPVVQSNKALLVNAQSSSPLITERAGVGGNEWVFRVNPTDDHFAPVFSKVIVELNKDKRVAFLSRNDDWGRAATKSFGDWIEKRGGTVVAKYFFPMEGPWDFTSFLARIKAENPDGVFFIAQLDQAVPFLQQFHEQGLKARIYNRGMSLGEELFKRVGSLANGAHVAEPYFVEVETEANRKFIQKFRNRWNQDPVYQAVTQYFATIVLAEAVRKAGKEDPEAVKNALKHVVMDTVTGRIEFDAHHQAYLNIFIAKAVCKDSQCKVQVVAEGRATPAK